MCVCVCVCVSIDIGMKLREMLPPPGGDVEPVEVGASGSMPVCTVSNWLDKTAPPGAATQRPRERTQERQNKTKFLLSCREARGPQLALRKEVGAGFAENKCEHLFGRGVQVDVDISGLCYADRRRRSRSLTAALRPSASVAALLCTRTRGKCSPTLERMGTEQRKRTDTCSSIWNDFV